ncbi:B12-binding domain-containing radical SAM protein [Streptosporangium canum]|uniref:B12-binding domain-containing radical SAM protein n=1 Tax=Streptosporangium canum TaxID=324952 RepID=UPI0037AD7363
MLSPTLSAVDVRRGHDRLLTVVGQLTTLDPAQKAAIRAIPYSQPNSLARTVADLLPGRRVVLTGTLEQRLLAISSPEPGPWLLASLDRQPHTARSWPAWAREHIDLRTPAKWISEADLDEHATHRLTRPTILLAALYRREHFPLPRFPLAISDLARAARATLSGHVELMDMQLGASLDDIITAVHRQRPDIVGISATFGQHELMTTLLAAIAEHAPPEHGGPLVLAGGSLTARNEAILLERYPHLLIARGAGEPTIGDVIAHWHGDLDREQIHGIGYQGKARGSGMLGIARRRTAVVPNRELEDFYPELDLVQNTFGARGVMQLEISRGCTNRCSFCPRGHKGTWAGGTPSRLPWLLQAIDTEFARHPEIARVLYLVDEEFIGGQADAVPRALAVADTIHRANFSWETSCRVDQVVDSAHDRDWHIERGHMWRALLQLGLRRCLFGVESGVTSVLERFNKETSGPQNALAIRTLSALGVPPRFTYITFDHLMDLAELKATHAFQARTDLLLKPLPHLSVEEIVDGVHDEDFVAAHSRNRPFYSGISYMLVGMECLIGAAYTNRVRAAGLAGHTDPSMGRIEARYADWRIGACAAHAQLWIDRNFALDYTLKSLEKTLNGQARHEVRAARVVIKDSAFAVLTGMLQLIGAFPAEAGAPQQDRFAAALQALLDEQLARLRQRMGPVVLQVAAALPPDVAVLLEAEHARWAASRTWTLINAADPCGT